MRLLILFPGLILATPNPMDDFNHQHGLNKLKFGHKSLNNETPTSRADCHIMDRSPAVLNRHQQSSHPQNFAGNYAQNYAGAIHVNEDTFNRPDHMISPVYPAFSYQDDPMHQSSGSATQFGIPDDVQLLSYDEYV
jgi:hypothetical protein